jgi:hypothetical protein
MQVCSLLGGTNIVLDFTLRALRALYEEFIANGYEVMPFQQYLTSGKKDRVLILRHDVDSRIVNAFKIALLENELGLRASYYIRYRKDLFNTAIMRKIAGMGHEIGYHYEDLSFARGDYGKAIERFRSNLTKFRRFYPVKTIGMHGSPLSKWDNRLIWRRYDYRDFGIIGEPYFDIDFSKVLYITDTGRRWDGLSINVRDKVKSHYQFNLESTFDIICQLRRKILPEKVMMNIHPHSWYDNRVLWLKEWFWQYAKNLGKYFIIKFRALEEHSDSNE